MSQAWGRNVPKPSGGSRGVTMGCRSGASEVTGLFAEDAALSLTELARWSCALGVDAWGLLTRLLDINVGGQDLHGVE